MPRLEQRRQQRLLRRTRVLVLIQEYDGEARPLGPGHPRRDLREPRSEGHDVAEVEQVPLPLQLGVAIDQGQQLLAGALAGEHLNGGLGERALAGHGRGQLRPLQQPRALVAHRLRPGEVLGQVAGQLQHRLDDRRLRPVDVAHRPVVRRDGSRGELPARRRRDQPGGRLAAEQQGVVSDEAGGVGVVGRDRRLGVHLTGSRGRTEGPQPRPDAGRQLARSLGGERQAKHSLGPHVAAADEPDDPGHHRRGLAAAGPGDHDTGLQRRGHDRGLLGAEPLAEHGLELLDGEGSGHRTTPCPSGWAGQLARTLQERQPSLTVAANVPPLIPSTTRATSACAQPGSGSSPSGP